jgi:hypothetical protein
LGSSARILLGQSLVEITRVGNNCAVVVILDAQFVNESFFVQAIPEQCSSDEFWYYPIQKLIRKIA